MEAVAKLRNHPSSPRKMRLVADMVRGLAVEDALNILKFTRKHAARPMEKLLMSAIANWQANHPSLTIEEADLFVKSVMVDSARMLKRFRPAPFGRAHRIRKRSNHVTLVVAAQNELEEDLFEDVLPQDQVESHEGTQDNDN